MKFKKIMTHVWIVVAADAIIIILGGICQPISGKNLEEVLKIGLSFGIPVWVILLLISGRILCIP